MDKVQTSLPPASRHLAPAPCPLTPATRHLTPAPCHLLFVIESGAEVAFAVAGHNEDNQLSRIFGAASNP